jgi:hypothetical protein
MACPSQIAPCATPMDRAHNPEVAGSNPAPATEKGPHTRAFVIRRDAAPSILYPCLCPSGSAVTPKSIVFAFFDRLSVAAMDDDMRLPTLQAAGRRPDDAPSRIVIEGVVRGDRPAH